MSKIFISYRRNDSAYPAHSIYDRLSEQFGRDSVFIDVDTIPFGSDFRTHLNDAVSQCDVLLVVIGSRWLNAKSENGAVRLEDPQDFVRVEIEAALSRNISVVPVLVDNVSMPHADELPIGLRDLAFRQATEVRPGVDFNSDVDRLTRGLKQQLRIDATSTKASAIVQTDSTTAQKNRTRSSSESVIANIAEQRPLQVIKDSIGTELTFVRAGQFVMGAPASDDEAFKDEQPQHTVEITEPFYLGIYPVLQVEYESVMATNPSRNSGDLRLPVENVNWFDAVDYCNRLSTIHDRTPYYDIRKTIVTVRGGPGYRLPTEAEWEYACRAGSTTKWSFGSDQTQLCLYAWYMKNSDRRTHPVGELLANSWGFFDMYGNVWEWCSDWHDKRHYLASPSTNPVGAKSGKERVQRGGSCLSQSDAVRTTRRRRHNPGDPGVNVGFRIARSAT